MLAAEARAKAEAARTKAAYAKRQVDMEVEKARIDATLHALKEEGEAEAASAAANVLEAAVDIAFKEHQKKSSHFSSAQQSMQRTSEYVNAHYNNQQTRKLRNGSSDKSRRTASSSFFTASTTSTYRGPQHHPEPFSPGSSELISTKAPDPIGLSNPHQRFESLPITLH